MLVHKEKALKSQGGGKLPCEATPVSNSFYVLAVDNSLDNSKEDGPLEVRRGVNVTANENCVMEAGSFKSMHVQGDNLNLL